MKGNLYHTYGLHEGQIFFFLHYHVVQLERNFYSLPPLISLSVFKFQVIWVVSSSVVQLTDKWPHLTFCQFRMMPFPVWQ